MGGSELAPWEAVSSFVPHPPRETSPTVCLRPPCRFWTFYCAVCIDTNLYLIIQVYFPFITHRAGLFHSLTLVTKGVSCLVLTQYSTWEHEIMTLFLWKVCFSSVASTLSVISVLSSHWHTGFHVWVASDSITEFGLVILVICLGF